MIPYISFDLETTGLDPSYCQVLEIGAVMEDWKSPIEKLRTFHTYIIRPEPIVGEPFALAMNAAILNKIANHRKYPAESFLTEELAFEGLENWLRIGGVTGQVQFGGKNFGAFDLQFVKQMKGGWRGLPMKHRFVDPAMMFWKPGEYIPNTADCKKLADLPEFVQHRAVEDALDIIRLVRTHFGIPL